MILDPHRVVFQRSISELPSDPMSSSLNSTIGDRLMTRRKRNNSGCVSDGGISLLKHPSAAMMKLISSAEKSPTIGSDKSLQRPVMAFIMQRHELDDLRVAMRQSLRKSACRTYAFQVGTDL